MSNTNSKLRAGTIFPKGNLVGQVSNTRPLIGVCKIGNVPTGKFITRHDIAETGSLVKYIDGELRVEDVVIAESTAY